MLLVIGCLIASGYNGQVKAGEEGHGPGVPTCRPTGGKFYRIEEAASPYEVKHYKDLLICGRKKRAMAGCSQLKELRSTILCLFPRRQDMHLSLHRASAYIEKGKVMLTDEQLRQDIGFDGHNLMRKDLMRYYMAFKRFKRDAGDEGRVVQENSFWNNFLLEKLKTHPDLILITAFDVPYMDLVVSHELLHAQFFSDPNYRQAVSDFWNKSVTEAHRTRIRNRLVTLYATIADLTVPNRSEQARQRARNVLLNEFQAYTLQIPEGDHLQDMLELTAPYRHGLRQYLTDCGVPPLEFGANKNRLPKSRSARSCLHLAPATTDDRDK